MIKKHVSLILILFFLIPGTLLLSQAKERPRDTKAAAPAGDISPAKVEKGNQLIIWSSADREVAEKMVFMYAYNCKKNKWMDNVRLLVWGPSAKLLSEDAELQKDIKQLAEAGVELWACKGCADLYKVATKLEELGINVHYTGKELAEMQKKGWFILTF